MMKPNFVKLRRGQRQQLEAHISPPFASVVLEARLATRPLYARQHPMTNKVTSVSRHRVLSPDAEMRIYSNLSEPSLGTCFRFVQ